MTALRRAPTGPSRLPPRLAQRARDLAVAERASGAIIELGLDLDRLLADEQRPAERMRMLRETTNRITRTANDAIQAYRRASRAVASDIERPTANQHAALEVQARLEEARTEILKVLALARQRYPWATVPSEPTPPIVPTPPA